MAETEGRSSQITENQNSDEVSCPVCPRTYKSHQNLRRHMKQFHQEPLLSIKRSIECALCKKTFSMLKLLREHLHHEHNFLCEPEKLHFKNEDEFLAWKKQIETDTKSEFRNGRGKRKTNDGFHIWYDCHLSGSCRKKVTKGLRPKDSKKMVLCCPAQMDVVITNSEVKVLYYGVHLGHPTNPGAKHLSDEEKAKLAEKMAMGMSIPLILSEIRSLPLQGEPSRYQLVTRKDLLNIRQQYNIDPGGQEYEMDLEKFVEKLGGIVLCFKPKSVVCIELQQLQADDFFLVLMSGQQIQSFKSFSNDSVCVDCSKDSNSCGYFLTTVSVLNESQRGFPVAFLISSSKSSFILTSFFSSIKKAIQPFEPHPRIFLSDITYEVYDAWSQVFGEVDMCLFCPWQFNRMWGLHLDVISNIRKKKSVEADLKQLMLVMDTEQFHSQLLNIHKKYLEDADTARFADFFYSTYEPFCKWWAPCYRFQLGPDKLVAIEKMNQSFHYERIWQRNELLLNKCIIELLDMVSEKGFEEIHMKYRRPEHEKKRAICLNHKKACNAYFQDNIFVDHDHLNVYYIPLKPGSDKFARVQKCVETCPHSCNYSCRECSVCIHIYKCTCDVNSVRNQMCPHIHIVCQKLASKEPWNSIASSSLLEEPIPAEVASFAGNVEVPPGTEFITIQPSSQNLKDGLKDCSINVPMTQLHDNPVAVGELNMVAQVASGPPPQAETASSRTSHNIDIDEDIYDLRPFSPMDMINKESDAKKLTCVKKGKQIKNKLQELLLMLEDCHDETVLDECEHLLSPVLNNVTQLITTSKSAKSVNSERTAIDWSYLTPSQSEIALHQEINQIVKNLGHPITVASDISTTNTNLYLQPCVYPTVTSNSQNRIPPTLTSSMDILPADSFLNSDFAGTAMQLDLSHSLVNPEVLHIVRPIDVQSHVLSKSTPTSQVFNNTNQSYTQVHLNSSSSTLFPLAPLQDSTDLTLLTPLMATSCDSAALSSEVLNPSQSSASLVPVVDVKTPKFVSEDTPSLQPFTMPSFLESVSLTGTSSATDDVTNMDIDHCEKRLAVSETNERDITNVSVDVTDSLEDSVRAGKKINIPKQGLIFK